MPDNLPSASTPAGRHDTSGIGGHPRGLNTLFFTEMWERFSYYGMRALLVLFMTQSAGDPNGGLGIGEGEAGAIYGIYTSLVYLLSLPGGWLADQLWGQRKTVFVGGCIIAAGHFSMAIPATTTFFLGLALIVIGTGLLKPNVSSMVGDLYEQGDARRDAGFSIYYMGINLGALMGPTLCGWIGETYNFHWGFSLAGIGMIAGLVQYRLDAAKLGSAGLLTTSDDRATLARKSRSFFGISAAILAALAIFAYLQATGATAVPIGRIAAILGSGILIVGAGFFFYVFLFGGLTPVEKKRLAVIGWLCLLAAVFWSGFEQAGSSMNLVARDWTDRVVLGWEIPTSWLQNINPIFIVLLAPVFAWLWVWLARRKSDPSMPAKFALALLILAAGFFVLGWGYANAAADNPAPMTWLIVTYFLHTVAELCLSPVGLSSMTKLAPKGRVGQMMGLWFIAAAFGNLIAGLIAGRIENLPPADLFGKVALFLVGAGVVATLLSPFVRRFTAGADEPA